ncbi:MAG: hypothetical protein FJY85_03805, partial [Deltaproteobacteria bacterium]|nr:hypothetical protein [Deltaproteobacteria bacterium]
FTSELAQPLQTEGIDLYPLCLESPRVGARTVDIANLWPSNGEHDEKLLLQINPDTARALRIETGDSIIVQGPKCETEARAWVSRAVPRDVVYATRALGGKRVLVVKRGQTSQEALHELKELLR